MIRKLLKRNELLLIAISLVLFFTTCRKENTSTQKTNPPVNPIETSGKLATADSIIVLKELYSGNLEAKRLAQNFPASDFSPTGFYLPAGGTVVIDLSFTKGSHRPVLLVGTYSRYNNKPNPTTYTLNAGRNNITDALGGIMYIRLFNDTPDTEIKLKFVSGFKAMPYFQIDKTTQAEWLAMLEKINDVPDVQLVGKKTIITYSYSNAIKYKNEDRKSLIEKADRVINIEDSISGLFGNDVLDQPNQHKYLLTESDIPDYYMATTNYRTWYRNPDAVSAILLADNLTWGPWHELGHMHQQGAWTWNELTEVTVNIYSLAVQSAFGLTSRLKQENRWAEAGIYLALPEASKNFNANSVSVWVRLCMFQQLKLAYGDEFYHNLHRTARRETAAPTTTDGKMKWFMIQSCKISKRNLSEFFKQWGIKLSSTALTDAAFAEIEALNLPKTNTDISLLQD